MTIPVSTVPAVISYLNTAIASQISGDSDHPNIDLVVGDPGAEPADVYIEIAKEIRRSLEPFGFVGGGGAGAFKEDYELDVVVSAAAATNSVTDVLTLVDTTWRMVAYVETAVRTDRSLGGLVSEADPMQSKGGEPTWSENGVGRICEVTVPVHVIAII